MKVNVKKIFINPYTISLVAVVALMVLIYHGTFSWLNSYTNHGVEIIVPDIKGLTEGEALPLLKEKKLKCEVNDSVYAKGKRRGEIIDQTPKPGETIKEGRTVYLIVNTNMMPKVAVPDVKEVSLRQAAAMINSVGLKVDSVMYVPSEFRDLVENVMYNNSILEVGARVPEGAALTLMVGRGIADEEVEMVSFRNLNITQATNKAHTAYLNIGSVYFDKTPASEEDKNKFFVYKQKPVTGAKVKFGEPVVLYLTKDPTMLEIPEEVYRDTFAVEMSGEDTGSERDELWQ